MLIFDNSKFSISNIALICFATFFLFLSFSETERNKTDKKNKTIILIIFSKEQGENHFRFSPVQILLKNIKLKTKLEPNSYSKV